MAKKIVIFASSAESLINFRYHLIKKFLDSNHVVVACAPVIKKNEKALNMLHELGVKFISLNLKNTSLNCFNDFFVFKEFFKIIKNEKPNIVFGYTIKPVIYGSISARFCKVDSIFSIITGLGYIFIGETLKLKVLRFFIERLYKIALKFNAKVFFQNPDDLDLFVSNKIVDKAKTVLINGSGVDLVHFVPLPLPDQIRFLFIGRLLRDKGIYEYVNAAKDLMRRYTDVEFLLVGDLDTNPTSITREELQKLIDEKVVKYLGHLDDVRVALAQASVFVLPSYREGTPRAVLEAMAVGRPIITTETPGCRETVEGVCNGFLVPVKNVDKLVKAMEKFILNPQLISKMGEESRRFVVKKYDVNNINQVILTSIGLV